MHFLQLLILILLAIFSFLLAKWITTKIIKPKIEKKASHLDEKLLYDQQATHIRESLESIYIKLEEYSKEVLSKLDTKILILHNLLLEADKKINLLKDTIKMSQPPQSTEISQKNELQEIHEQVYKLYKEGIKPQDIAKQLNLQVSEINLILALKNIHPT